MYLHGDGGSRIYYADALDKSLATVPGQEVELTKDQEELKKSIGGETRFNCVLTNPPFSMTKELANETEAHVLKQYDLAKIEGTSRLRNSLRSNAMFMERYRDLLVEGGRLLTVIDDGLLAGDDFKNVRDFIREEYLIRGIISLPGDAFQRSGARAKTTILYLEKRKEDEDEGQPDVFVYECRYVGLDDMVPKTRPSVADQARKNAEQEMEEVLAAFDEYMSGKVGPWLVPAERISNRLDAKSLRPWRAIELQPKWTKVGADSDILANLVDPVWEPVSLEPNRRYKFLRVLYAGYAETGEASLGKEVGYSAVSTAKAGDIVVSHINAVNRAICVLPESAKDLLISKEYTILRPKKNKVDPNYLWAVLRSAAVVAEWLSGSTGVGRHRVGWDQLSSQRVPLLGLKEQKAIGDYYRKAQEHESKIADLRASATAALAPLELEGETAVDRLERAKPPK